MSEIQKLKSFIDSLQYREMSGAAINPVVGQFPFVTISRQAGAGGQTLAKALLEKISRQSHEPLFQKWQLCSQEICHLLAQDPALKEAVESLLQTEYHSHAEDILGQLILGGASQDKVVKKMFRLMRAFAVHGKVIFVGRGAAFLTRDLPGGIHVQLIASLETRVKRVMTALDLSEKSARELIAEKDKAKAELVKTFFHKDVHDPLAFDVVWNTERVEISEIVEIIMNMIRRKAALIRA